MAWGTGGQSGALDAERGGGLDDADANYLTAYGCPGTDSGQSPVLFLWPAWWCVCRHFQSSQLPYGHSGRDAAGGAGTGRLRLVWADNTSLAAGADLCVWYRVCADGASLVLRPG